MQKKIAVQFYLILSYLQIVDYPLLTKLFNNFSYTYNNTDILTMDVKQAEQPVDEATRDKVFAQLKTVQNNNMCLDCDKKNPKWASIHLGIHLCYDCAGKHRQYGVIYSFIKSINLDVWNQKQLLFMQKGGNSKALQYFQKRGIITPNNKHIDYKSPIVQQYKTLLTEDVELELAGGKKKVEPEKKTVVEAFQELQKEEKKIEIPQAQTVQNNTQKVKGKKEKKKIGAKRINLQDFQNLAFDDGVSAEQKNKIVKQYEKQKDIIQTPVSKQGQTSSEFVPPPKIQQPKELSQEQVKKKMESLKLQTNLKTISSQQFKDMSSVDQSILKQNRNKFSGSSSISSSAYFNKQEEAPTANPMQNIKDLVSNAGQKIFSKLSGLSGYWNK